MSSSRIAFIVNGNYIAGAELANFNLIRDLHKKGNKLLVVTSGWNNGQFAEMLDQIGVKYISIKLGFVYISKPLWTLDTLINYPTALRALSKQLKDFSPNYVVHSSYRNFLMGYFTFRKYNNIYWEHDEQAINDRHKKLYKFLNSKINKFICPSKPIQSQMLKLGIERHKISVIPSALDPELEDYAPTQSILNTEIKIGIVGQIIPRKGFDYIFDYLKEIDQNFLLLIYGDDNNEYALSLKQNIPKNLFKKVRWCGYESNRNKIFTSIDLLLFPTHSESFGRVIIEAAAFEVPTFATNLACFETIILPNKTGYLFNEEDKDDFVCQFSSLLKKRELILELGKNARKHVVNNFNSEKCTNLFLKILS
jgi:glycosyltransferase involved in cell wall biosynthesis